MTTQDFHDKYGETWTRFSKTAMFSALMAVIEEYQPMRIAYDPTTVASDPQIGNAIFNRANGYEHCHRLIRDVLTQQPKAEMPKEEYNTEEDI